MELSPDRDMNMREDWRLREGLPRKTLPFLMEGISLNNGTESPRRHPVERSGRRPAAKFRDKCFLRMSESRFFEQKGLHRNKVAGGCATGRFAATLSSAEVLLHGGCLRKHVVIERKCVVERGVTLENHISI